MFPDYPFLVTMDKLRGKIAKMERHKERDKAMKNNSIFQKKMRESSTRKKVRDQNTKDKY